MRSFLLAVAFVLGALLSPMLVELAHALTWSPAAPTYTVVKGAMYWNADGTRTVEVWYKDAQGNVRTREPFLIDSGITSAKDRFGVTVANPSGSFQSALTTIETQIDGTLSALQAGGKLNPPL